MLRDGGQVIHHELGAFGLTGATLATDQDGLVGGASVRAVSDGVHERAVGLVGDAEDVRGHVRHLLAQRALVAIADVLARDFVRVDAEALEGVDGQQDFARQRVNLVDLEALVERVADAGLVQVRQLDEVLYDVLSRFNTHTQAISSLVASSIRRTTITPA